MNTLIGSAEYSSVVLAFSSANWEENNTLAVEQETFINTSRWWHLPVACIDIYSICLCIAMVAQMMCELLHFYSINKVYFFHTNISHFLSKHFPPVASVTLPLIYSPFIPCLTLVWCSLLSILSIITQAHFNAAKFQRLKGTIACWETVGRSSVCLQGKKSIFAAKFSFN